MGFLTAQISSIQMYRINAMVCAWEWSQSGKKGISLQKRIMGSDSNVIKYVQQLILSRFSVEELKTVLCLPCYKN